METFKNKLPTTRKMTPGEFIVVPDNTRQRDTEKHSEKAVTRHLGGCHDVHARVSIAKLANGDEYKLDGHTRCLLWENGDLKPPEKLLVDVWKVADVEAAESLYLTFDNRDAAEFGNDVLFGTLRSRGVDISSMLMKTCGLLRAVKMLIGQLENLTLEIPDFLLEPIGIVDSWGFTGTRINSGMLSAMIVTAYADGEKAKAFWAHHVEDEGMKKGKDWDGVYGLTVVRERMRGRDSGIVNMREVCRRSLSCYIAYQENRTLSQNAKETKVTSLMPEARDY